MTQAVLRIRRVQVVGSLLRGSLPAQRCIATVFGWPWPWRSEKRLKRKEKKLKEKGRGYVVEWQEFRENKGKQFKAKAHLLPKHKCVTFPALTKSALDGSLVTLPLPQTSLVVLHFKDLGERMSEKYKRRFEAEFGDTVSTVELSMLEKWSFSVVHRWIESNLRRTVPTSKQGMYLVLTGDMVCMLRSSLEIHNGLLGYVFLVDSEGLIRWRAHGEGTHSELQAMIKCTYDLINSNTTAKHGNISSTLQPSTPNISSTLL